MNEQVSVREAANLIKKHYGNLRGASVDAANKLADFALAALDGKPVDDSVWQDIYTGNEEAAKEAGDALRAKSKQKFERLVEWLRDPQRKPAHLAFTAGSLRDAATAFELANTFPSPPMTAERARSVLGVTGCPGSQLGALIAASKKPGLLFVWDMGDECFAIDHERTPEILRAIATLMEGE